MAPAAVAAAIAMLFIILGVSEYMRLVITAAGIKDAMESVPFVVVQALDGFDANGLHRVRVALRLCIVGDDLEEGEEDLQNFISTLRLSLLSLPDGLLNARFRMVEDEQGRLGFWERPDEQAYPFLQAHIFTTWEMQGVTNVTV